MKQYKVRYPGLRVRKQPTTAAQIVGMLREGAVIDVEHNVTVGANIWHALGVSAGGAPLLASDDMGAAGLVYAAHIHSGTQFTDEVGAVTPPPPASTGFRTGVNAKTNFHLTRQAFQDGCRYAMIIDDFSLAGDLSRDYPGSTVMARRWFEQGRNVTSVQQALDALEGAQHPNVVYTLWNEGDAGRPLAAQAKLEIDLAREIKRRSGARFAAGTFAMGTVDFTNPTICAEVRDAYSAAYNAGEIAFDMHLYSPDMMHIWQDDGLIWYERRWEFLFTRCGFDPRVRAIYCGETGVDQGGVGGFPAHGASGADVARWVRRNAEVQQRPITVNGVSYPSPAIGGAIFQLGDSNSGAGGWAGYNVEYALPELRTFWSEGG
jgi:hypothetical protein